MIITLLTLILALGVFFIGYVGLGHTLVRWSRISITAVERLLLAVWLGLATGVTVIAFSGIWLGTTAYLLWWTVAIPVGLFETRHLWATLRRVLNAARKNLVLVIGASIAGLFFVSTLGLSGVQTDGSLRLQDVHDSMWHVALIEEAATNLPPRHPAFTQLPLQNYHYFYDLFLASLVFVSQAPILPIYFQFSPLLLTALLLTAAAVLGWKLGGNTGAAWLTFLTICCGNFAYFIPWFIPGQPWHESSFWVSQTFGMLVNPQVIYTLGLIMGVLWLLSLPKKNLGVHAILILLIASSLGFKSYAWVVLGGLYGVSLIWDLWQKRFGQTIAIAACFGVASLPFLWLITGFQTSQTFFWAPLWFLSSMVEAPDRLNLVRWKLLEDYYRSEGVWYRVLEIQIKEFLIFYSGNLGIRTLGLLGLPLVLWQYFRKNGIGKSNPQAIFWLSLFGFLFSTTIPLLLLQKAGGVWNSIQFWYYGLIFANVFLTILILQISKVVQSRVVKGILSVALISLAVPTLLQTLWLRWNSSYTLLPTQYAAISSLQNQDRILICPSSDEVFETLLIEGISPASVYLSNPNQLELFGIRPPDTAAIEAVFTDPASNQSKDWLRTERITHLLCNKPATNPDDNNQPLGTWRLQSVEELP